MNLISKSKEVEDMQDVLNKLVISDVDRVFSVTFTNGKRSTVSERATFGISFCTEGKIVYTHKGKQYIEDKNHAVLLPMGESYSLLGKENGSFPVINFSCEGIPFDSVISFPIKNPERFIKDYEKMLILSSYEGNRMKLISILYDILYNMLITPTLNTLAPALKYIEKNYHDPKLDNAVLAERCRISEVYFRKLFTEQYRISPKQFIIDIRISKAKQLLSEGNMKIISISEVCGFSNQYHFCRTFKAHVGMTPTEYMMDNRTLNI